MNLKRTSFDNLSEFLDYLYKTLYIDCINVSFEFTDITIKNSIMNFHVYVIPKGFTFKSNEEVNTVMSRCTSNDTYTQVIIGYNIKINSDVILTPPKRCKGLIIYDKGMLSNFGSISMYARGCIAIGQDIYLTHTEFVPAIGSAGGASNAPTYGWSGGSGNNGINGSNRKSGGGGAGAYRYYNSKSDNKNGAGSSGTSYSGGSGGGAGMYNHDDVGGTSSSNPQPVSNGGKGGDGSTSEWYFDGIFASGGQGNPSGGASSKGSVSYSIPQDQPEGTGGLLIIYCDNLYNTGNINTNGVIAKYVNVTISVTNNNGRSSGAGGSSGGGSLNIFCNRLYDGLSKGTITSNGGASQLNVVNGSENFRGGAGGNGCVTIDALETYTEFEYDDSLYNNNEYIELPEPQIKQESEVSEDSYYVSDFITYNGHIIQEYPIIANKTYYIECWGARGSSEDGDIYSGKQEGQYGSYSYGVLKLDHNDTLKISVGESGGCGGGGWPEYKNEERIWGVDNSWNPTKNYRIVATAGGSTTIKLQDNSIVVQSKGGKSGTTSAAESSPYEKPHYVDMSLSSEYSNTTINSPCELISYTNNSISIKYSNVLEMNYWAVLIFSISKTTKLSFSYQVENDKFAEFRIGRAYDLNRQTKYESKWYTSGNSGNVTEMLYAANTPYVIQVKSSQAITFTFTLSKENLNDIITSIYYGTNVKCTEIYPDAILNEHTHSPRLIGPIDSNITNYNTLSQLTSYTFNSAIPQTAGYHGAVRITSLISGTSNNEIYQYKNEVQKITLIPNKLGSNYINTKFLLECHGASSFNGIKGSCIKCIISIDNPLILFCKIGEKGKGNNISYNNIIQMYNYEVGNYITPLSFGGCTTITTKDEKINNNNLLINSVGGGYLNTNVNVSGYRCYGPNYYITYESITSTSTTGRIYVVDADNNSTMPCVLIIIPQSSGSIIHKSENVTTGSARGAIRRNDNSVITYNYYGFNQSTSVSIGTTYKLACGTSYGNSDSSPSEYRFIITYPKSYTYILDGERNSNPDSGAINIVENNIMYKYSNLGYIDNNFYSKKYFRQVYPCLSLINQYNDSGSYMKFKYIQNDNSFQISLINVTDYNAYVLIRKLGGRTYGRVLNTTKGTARIYCASSNSSYPSLNKPNISSYGSDISNNNYFMNYWSGYRYIVVFFGGKNSSPASYDILISDTTLSDILIPVNGIPTSIYSLGNINLKTSDIIQKNSEFNNYTNPLLTDVSISQSDIDGNGRIYISKLPVESDDYILDPSNISIKERNTT